MGETIYPSVFPHFPHFYQRETDPPNIVRALVFVGSAVKAVRLHVSKSIIVNSRVEWGAELREGYRAKASTVLLPRNMVRYFVYEVPLDTSSRDAEADLLYTLRCDPNVDSLFESHVSAKLRCHLQVGNMCTLDVAAHRARNLPQSADLFYVNDLAAVSAAGQSKKTPNFLASAHRVFTPPPVSPIFLYMAESVDGRGVVALFLPHRALCRIAIVKNPATPNPVLTQAFLNTMFQQVASNAREAEPVKTSSNFFTAVPEVFDFDVTYTQNMPSAVAAINSELEQDFAISRRLFALAQTSLPPKKLHSFFSLDSVPVLTVPYNKTDVNIFDSAAVQWEKEILKRAFFRFHAALPYTQTTRELSLFSGIPVCDLVNDSGDSGVYALDVLFGRQLQNAYYCLWVSDRGEGCDLGRIDVSDEDLVVKNAVEEAERPVAVQVSGSHHTWVVEFEVVDLEVISILAEDTEDLTFTSGGISSSFHCLRKMIWSLYHIMLSTSGAGKHHPAEFLIQDVVRWVRSRSSLLYEPQLMVYVWNLSKQLFGRLLTRLTKLGCKIIYGGLDRVIAATPKTGLKECGVFVSYLLTAIKDQAIFKKVDLVVSSLWSEYLFVDKNNYAGMKVPDLKELPGGRGVDLTCLKDSQQDNSTVLFFWTIADRLPSSVKTRFYVFIAEYLNTLSRVKKQVMEEVLAEGSLVTLASTTEKVRKRTFKMMQQKVESDWTSHVLRTVHNIQVDQKDMEKEAGRPLDADQAVEYIKILCFVLGQEPQLAESVRFLKTAVLQICGVASHSKESEFVPQTDLYTLDNCMCSFCHCVGSLDLTPGGLHSPDAFRIKSVFTCTQCQQPFNKAVIESRLVSIANTLVSQLQTYDLQCAVCKQPQEYDMQLRCICGGEWVVSQNHDSVQTKHQLGLLNGIADLHGMQWLKSVSDQLLI